MVAVDDFVKVLDAVSRLISAIALPLLILIVLVRFGSVFRDFLRNLNEFTLKGAGFEASAKRQQAEAAGALVAAAVSRPDVGADTEQVTRDARAAATVVTEAVTPRIVRQASRATALWVDDHPNNNIFERQSLEAIGVVFTLSPSTDDALERLRRQPFDVIISDMGRPPDQRAGYTLLRSIRGMGNRTPFIIYAGSDAPEHRAEAIQNGALGSTNRPDELFRLVLSVIERLPEGAKG